MLLANTMDLTVKSINVFKILLFNVSPNKQCNDVSHIQSISIFVFMGSAGWSSSVHYGFCKFVNDFGRTP